MDILKPYDQLYTTDKTYIIIKSGREAGKSKAAAQFSVHKFFQEEGDQVITRAYSSDLRQSMYTEILAVIQEIDYEMGSHLYNQVETRTRPLKIVNKLNGNVIHFKGIGGADLERTKGFTTEKQLSLVMVEEMQQVETEGNLKEALDTFMRKMKDDAKVLMLFNPKKRASHWVNEYYRIKEYNDDNFLCIHTSYMSIAQYLNRHALASIEAEREVNPTEYKHRFLGETEGLFGAVYSSFDRDKHLLGEDFAKTMVKKIGIHAFLVGADPASTRDATALVPIILLKNGQMMVVDYFYHDPQKNGVVTNDKLTPIIQTWLEETMKKWNMNERMRVDMVFDSNAVSQDLMRTIQYRFPANFQSKVFSQKRVIEMADIIRDAFSRNLVYIVDQGGYYNWVTGKFIYGVNPLVTQLEQNVWNENGDGFDKNVPNDMTDALTYGTVHYLKNKGNMYFPMPKNFYEPIEKEDYVDE